MSKFRGCQPAALTPRPFKAGTGASPAPPPIGQRGVTQWHMAPRHLLAAGPAPGLQRWGPENVLRRRRRRRRWGGGAGGGPARGARFLLLGGQGGSGSPPRPPAASVACEAPRLTVLFHSRIRAPPLRPPIRSQDLETDPFSLLLLTWALITHIDTLRQGPDSCPLIPLVPAALQDSRAPAWPCGTLTLQPLGTSEPPLFCLT